MKRQTRLQQLVEDMNAAARGESVEAFEASQRALADYVRKNIQHITIASDK